MTDPPCLDDDEDWDEPPLGEVLDLSIKLQSRPWVAVLQNANGQTLMRQTVPPGWSMARLLKEDLTVTFSLERT